MKRFKAQSALMTLLSVVFVALFAVGCGDSREDFVVTNNNNNPAVGTGNLVFRFQRANAQVADVVPAGTVSLRFDFFSTNPGTQPTLLFTETRTFAEVITIEDVPANTLSVAVTAIGADNLPLAAFTGATQVIVGENNEVDLSDATPVTFDAVTFTPATINLVNGGTAQLAASGAFTPGGNITLPINAQVAQFSFSRAGIANVSATGLVTDTSSGGNTTLTATYTALGAPRTSTVVINTFGFEAFADTSQVIGSNDTSDFEVAFTNNAGVTTEVGSNVATSYALVTPVDNVTVNSTNGNLTTTGASPGPVNVRVTYVDPRSGLTFTDVVTINLTSTPT